MPRPCKKRRICAMPDCRRFAPADGEVKEQVMLSLDEYESIRLIDLLGLSQEESAASMDVARTTVQAVYASARRKLADVLVNGRELVIGGGSVVVCQGPEGCCRRNSCPRKCERK
jgi:predicted DNA-binding protein (UPF0251 family)